MFNLKITIEVIGHITKKKHTNVATKHIIFGKIFWNSLPREGLRAYMDQRWGWAKCCYQGQVKWVHSRSNQEISMKC